MSYELIIEPRRVERNYWGDLWRFRDLLLLLAYRDILVRYKQTVLGAAWTLIRPLLAMAVFVAFRRLTKISTPGIPDPLVVYSAIIPWQFFSTAVTEASGSLIGNANLVSKVYFPRILIPISAILTTLVDVSITFILMALLMVFYGCGPGWNLLALPALMILVTALSFGSGVLLAALNVEFRDFRYIVPFVVQFGFFVSPIAIQTAMIPDRWRLVYLLNPLAGIIDGFRWTLLGGRTSLDPAAIALATVETLSVLIAGIWYFRRTERGFADII